jgi:hypothetical protein
MAQLNEPSCSPHDPLTAGLLPVVIHQLNNATQLLANFQALLSLGGAEEILRARSGDIADTAKSVHELGYVLAVIASASGADLLLERREERGLDWIFETVRDGLRRDSRDLRVSPTPLPGLSAAVGEGWELPWAFGAMLYSTGLAGAADETLDWSLERHGDAWRLQIEGHGGANHDALRRAVLDRLPQARFLDVTGALCLELPADWLREASTVDASRGAAQ